jgi:hypothetical protein
LGRRCKHAMQCIALPECADRITVWRYERAWPDKFQSLTLAKSVRSGLWKQDEKRRYAQAKPKKTGEGGGGAFENSCVHRVSKNKDNLCTILLAQPRLPFGDLIQSTEDVKNVVPILRRVEQQRQQQQQHTLDSI